MNCGRQCDVRLCLGIRLLKESLTGMQEQEYFNASEMLNANQSDECMSEKVTSESNRGSQ